MTSASATPHQGRESLIDDLEEALSTHSMRFRADTLQRVADLFLSGPAQYSEAEIALFGDVMVRLLVDIETRIKAALADRLAKVANAPAALIRALANDVEIEVAQPVLKHSERLDDDALIDTARTASQNHLLAISQRQKISESVTDALLEFGDAEVARSVVRNDGAKFSENGLGILVEKSKDDDALALGVWARSDIPHRVLVKVFCVASFRVRTTLEAADRKKSNLIRGLVSEVSNEIQSQLRTKSRDFVEAEKAVRDLLFKGALDEFQVQEFAKDNRFEEVTISLALLADLPLSSVERAMVQERDELVLLMTRAIDFSWNTTKLILLLRSGAEGRSASDLANNLTYFGKLRPDTARRTLQFVKLREQASDAKGAATP